MSGPLRSRIGVASAFVVLLLAAGAAGWAIGHSGKTSPVFKVEPGLVYATPSEGTAYLGANQPLNRQPRGIAYSFPPGIKWIDANGSINDGGRPACIRYYRAVRVKKMEAVIYPYPDGGGFSGTVVWVQC
jgi:hypothetical protein